MQPDAVPPDLVAALLAAGYRVGGPVGFGAHGPAWGATGVGGGPEAGSRVVVTMLAVPAGPHGDSVRGRLDTLRAVRHEHLAEILDVVPVSGAREAGRWAVLLAEVAGPNLAALLAARPPLAAGEAVTLVVPLAGALAALHDAGLVHGDVSPANVVVRPDGRPVLVDLLGAVTAEAGSRAGRGTPGFAAPEVESGSRPGPASDIHALARVALSALEPGSDLALRAVLEGACTRAANDRPSATELAARCFAAARPEPLDLPDDAVLARTTLARLATGGSPRTAVTRQPPGSRHRADRRVWRTVVRAGAVVGVVAGCAAVVVGVAGVGPAEIPSARAAHPAAPAGTSTAVPPAAEPTSGADSTTSSRSRSRSDPVGAAVSLTEERTSALVAGDPAGLDAVEVSGAPAHRADVRLLAGLRAAGLRIDGLRAKVVKAKLVDDAGLESDAGGPDGAPSKASARVEVTSSLTAHSRRSADGAVVAKIAAQPARPMVLELAWTPAGWRVVSVTEPG